jgi:GntR family transcriptional repressor for pyruvate dehydrogenase complex
MKMDAFQPIKDRDKIEQIVNIFKTLIIQGELQPGNELPSERELSARFQVSRYSLREALRSAQAQGLIELNQGKRARVAEPSHHAASEIMGIAMQRNNSPLSDLITARISLECDIASIVARKASPELLKKLEIVTKQMELHKDDLEYCAKKDVEFHELLVEATDNVVFQIMLASVASLLKASRLATLKHTGVDRALNGHRSIMFALKEHEQEKARAAMRAHLEMAEDDIIQIEGI